MPPDLEIVQEWLTKAAHDLEGARQLLQSPKPLPDLVLFHCQQTVEKSLNAFIEFCEARPPKTHAVGQLLDLAQAKDGGFASLQDADWLSLYAVANRYPGFEPEATRELAEEGVGTAEAVLRFVLDRLPEKVRP